MKRKENNKRANSKTMPSQLETNSEFENKYLLNMKLEVNNEPVLTY